MRRLLRWVMSAVLVFGLWVALVLSEWLPRPTAQDMAALAALEPVPANVSGERDGSAAMWLMSYAVPEDQLAAVMAADVEAYNAALQIGGLGNFQSSAKGRFADIATPNGKDPALCEAWADSCLARVQKAPEVTRKVIADFAPRLERSRWLAHYDHFPYGFEPRYDSPIGSTGSVINLALADAALKFVDGNRAAAFASLCADTASWRQVRSHTDMLIYDMIGVAQMANATKLYAEMLLESPPEMAPPCPEVFAPLTDEEANQCAVMRNEFLSTKYSFESNSVFPGPASTENSILRPLVNDANVIRHAARSMAPYCQEIHRQRIAQRDPVIPPVATDCTAVDKFFDPLGCSLIGATGPDYSDYYWRILDLDARMRLLANAVAMRGMTPELAAAAFSKRPPERDSARHAFEWDGARQVLRMRNLEDNRGEFWELPVLVSAAVIPVVQP